MDPFEKWKFDEKVVQFQMSLTQTINCGFNLTKLLICCHDQCWVVLIFLVRTNQFRFSHFMRTLYIYI